MAALDLFPETAAIEGSELTVGGLGAWKLAQEFGTPLVVYCEETLRAAARAYREAAPDAVVVYGSKAFPNVAVLQVLAEEGIGADVSTLGELRFAQAAGMAAARLIVHGNNKSDEELQAAAEANVWLVVLDSVEEVDRAASAGVRRVLLRVTPGIEADTHAAIRTGHLGSKFGLPPAQAAEALARARDVGLEVLGLHVHIGSQLVDLAPYRSTIDWLAAFAAELDYTPRVLDVGGGLGIDYVEDAGSAPRIGDWIAAVRERVGRAWELHRLPVPQLVLEPGRSLVGRAGFTLYRVGVVKRATESTTYVAVDGGISDNPRPLLYGARLTALLANRADTPATGSYAVAGKHCESGDVLIEHVELPEPERGDLLAIPATGAYTLAMSSNYNALPRPAAVLVRDGHARLIRRRETLDDLLAKEVSEPWPPSARQQEFPPPGERRGAPT